MPSRTDWGPGLRRRRRTSGQRPKRKGEAMAPEEAAAAVRETVAIRFPCTLHPSNSDRDGLQRVPQRWGVVWKLRRYVLVLNHRQRRRTGTRRTIARSRTGFLRCGGTPPRNRAARRGKQRNQRRWARGLRGEDDDSSVATGQGRRRRIQVGCVHQGANMRGFSSSFLWLRDSYRTLAALLVVQCGFVL